MWGVRYRWSWWWFIFLRPVMLCLYDDEPFFNGLTEQCWLCYSLCLLCSYLYYVYRCCVYRWVKLYTKRRDYDRCTVIVKTRKYEGFIFVYKIKFDYSLYLFSPFSSFWVFLYYYSYTFFLLLFLACCLAYFLFYFLLWLLWYSFFGKSTRNTKKMENYYMVRENFNNAHFFNTLYLFYPYE